MNAYARNVVKHWKKVFESTCNAEQQPIIAHSPGLLPDDIIEIVKLRPSLKDVASTQQSTDQTLPDELAPDAISLLAQVVEDIELD